MKPKVLIVDDDRMLAELYNARFKEEKFDVRAVYSAAETLKILRGFDPDVIILDICLPDLSGFKLFDMIEPQVREGNIKVVFLTALNLNSHDHNEAIKRGRGCLFKVDVLPKDLVKLVNKLAEEKTARAHA